MNNTNTLFVRGSNSQAFQESFVLNVLNFKRNGYYVELGAGWPKKNSNTYLLETEYCWRGVAFENDKGRHMDFVGRKNPCLFEDAILFNYKKYFKENNFPSQIDYLQMDLHPASSTLAALKNLPLDEYRFSIITYEHNGYIDKKHQEIKLESSDILNNLGYYRVVNNLTYENRAYEDWWIDHTVIDYNSYSNFISTDIDCRDLFNWKE